ncbi:hypothetical protein ABPG72_002783 [Tetrahymena utriculariae]
MKQNEQIILQSILSQGKLQNCNACLLALKQASQSINQKAANIQFVSTKQTKTYLFCLKIWTTLMIKNTLPIIIDQKTNITAKNNIFVVILGLVYFELRKQRKKIFIQLVYIKIYQFLTIANATSRNLITISK